MDTAALEKMQQDIAERVKNNSLSFGKRATNLMKAVLTGAGLNFVGQHVVARTFPKDKRDALNEEVKSHFSQDSGGSNAWDHAKYIMESDSPAASSFRNRIYTNLIVSIGSVIPATILLNRSSKNKQQERLSFVDSELERRKAAHIAVDHPTV